MYLRNRNMIRIGRGYGVFGECKNHLPLTTILFERVCCTT